MMLIISEFCFNPLGHAQLPVAPMRRQPQTPQTPSVEGGMTMAQRVMTSAAMWPKDLSAL